MTLNGEQPKNSDRSIGRSRLLLFFVAPIAFFVLAGALGFQLLTGDPRSIPSALIDKPVPKFDLPALSGFENGFSSSDLQAGEIVLVNVFASWCGPCLVEHPLLMNIAKKNSIKIYGINYKDLSRNSINWLNRYGNPYSAIGVDSDGRVGIDWGVYGVPETFVVDGNGRIRFKHIGMLSADDLSLTILPLVEELRR